MNLRLFRLRALRRSSPDESRIRASWAGRRQGSASVVLIVLAAAVAVCALFVGAAYNGLVKAEETATANWTQVLNQYKSRADLTPQLVNVVKGYATHEKEFFENIAQARSAAGGVNVSSETIPDAETQSRYISAQNKMGSALGQLLMVAEKYPDLKANQNFAALQQQLEGRENRVSVARRRYIEAVRDYNVKRRQFPTTIVASLFGFEEMQTFTVDNADEISAPPQVDFGK